MGEKFSDETAHVGLVLKIRLAARQIGINRGRRDFAQASEFETGNSENGQAVEMSDFRRINDPDVQPVVLKILVVSLRRKPAKHGAVGHDAALFLRKQLADA